VSGEVLTGEFSGVSPFIYASQNAGSLEKKKGVYHPLPSHEMIQIQTGSEAYLAPMVIPFEMDGL
jgi:hypothetical protein